MILKEFVHSLENFDKCRFIPLPGFLETGDSFCASHGFSDPRDASWVEPEASERSILLTKSLKSLCNFLRSPTRRQSGNDSPLESWDRDIAPVIRRIQDSRYCEVLFGEFQGCHFGTAGLVTGRPRPTPKGFLLPGTRHAVDSQGGIFAPTPTIVISGMRNPGILILEMRAPGILQSGDLLLLVIHHLFEGKDSILQGF